MTGRSGLVKALLATALLLPLIVALAPQSASAKDCTAEVDGETVIVDCDQVIPGEDAGDSGPSEPTCEFVGQYNEYCIGEAACWGNDPAAVQDPKELEGVKPPSKDAHVVYKECRNPDGSIFDEWSWSTEGGPSIEDRIISARGLLNPPSFKPTFNPPGRTIVNLPTWWWADGAPAGQIEGSEAFGVRAIASPDHMVVDPGDGSGTFTCQITTSKSDACTHTYRRASGSSDYAASVSLVYNVSFEMGGEPVNVDGLSPDLLTMEATEDVPVPVREIQSVVTDVG